MMVISFKVPEAVFVAASFLIMIGGPANGGVAQNDSGATSETVRALGAASSSQLQLFDAHAHQMPTSYSEDWLESLFSDHDPSGIVLLGIGNVIVHQDNYPTKVAAFSNFKDVSDIDLNEIDRHLKMGMRGIGEISIRHFASGPPPAQPVETNFDEPELLAVYDLARQYSVPVIFHFDYHEDHIAEIERTLPDYSDVTFIWAHAGDAQPKDLIPLLDQFENLHIDVSSRNPIKSFDGRLVDKHLQRLDQADGNIKSDWKSLFNAFPNRVLYGSDIGPPGRLEDYGKIQNYYRKILDQLDVEIAEQIAFKNAQTLFMNLVAQGDVNNDGSVDNLDITPFIGALSAADEAAFQIQFPEGHYDAADIDLSGQPDNLDITPFIGLLTASASNTNAVPEPAAFTGLVFGLMAFVKRPYRQ